MDYKDRGELKQAWGLLFAKPRGASIFPARWDYFVTATWDPNRGKPLPQRETAAQTWKYFLRLRAIRKAWSRVVWVVEGPSGGHVHIHALWESTGKRFTRPCDGCPGKLSRRKPCLGQVQCGGVLQVPEHRCLNEEWYSRHGIARWAPFREDIGRGGATYAAKYLFADDSKEEPLWGIEGNV